MNWFETIDGEWAKPDNICGYCKAKKGCLTRTQRDLHMCSLRPNGEPCMHYIKFNVYDPNKQKQEVTGEAYREKLKRKKHH